MKIKIVGCGAAGNKALICAIEKGVIGKEDSLLVNTTIKDVDPAYSDIFMQLGNTLKGCGKERTLAKNITLQHLKAGSDEFDTFINTGDPDMIVFVTSTSGGSGSGSTTLLAKYVKSVLGKNVHIFGFTGFEADGRELQNTIEFFQDMEEDFGVEALSNNLFLDGFNTIEAEKAANEAFADKIAVLQGLHIRDSVQNIDDTDLYKLVTTPRFMVIESVQLPKIRNSKDFESCIKEVLDDSKSLETSVGCHRLGVIINCRKDALQYIDTQMNIVRSKYGVPYESFLHIQHEDDMPEFVEIIVAGMKLPTDELTAIYDRYKQKSAQVNKEKDSFFDDIGSLRGDPNDSMFNLQTQNKKASKNDFFGSLDGTIEKY